MSIAIHIIIVLSPSPITFYKLTFSFNKEIGVYFYIDGRYASIRVTAIWNNLLSGIYSTWLSPHWLRLMELLAKLVVIDLIKV